LCIHIFSLSLYNEYYTRGQGDDSYRSWNDFCRKKERKKERKNLGCTYIMQPAHMSGRIFIFKAPSEPNMRYTRCFFLLYKEVRNGNKISIKNLGIM